MRNIEDGPLYDPLNGPRLYDVEQAATFEHSASLRVFGESLDFDEIGARLGLAPTDTHRAGDRPREGSSTIFMHDMWSYTTLTPEERPLDEHIDALWRDIAHAADYLLSLKDRATVEVFLGYRSDWVDGGVEVSHGNLEMFTRLEIPFSLSIIRL